MYNDANTEKARTIPLLKRFPAIEHKFMPGNPVGIVNSLETARTTPAPHLIKTRLPAQFYKKQVGVRIRHYYLDSHFVITKLLFIISQLAVISLSHANATSRSISAIPSCVPRKIF